MQIRKVLLACCLTIGTIWAAEPKLPPRLSPAKGSVRAGNSISFNANWSGAAAATEWSAVSTDPNFAGDVGKVSSRGVYTAPAVPPVPNTVLVRAVSHTNRSVVAAATVTVLNPVPNISSIYPASVNPGAAYLIDVLGDGYISTSQVAWAGNAIKTTYVSSTHLQISGTANVVPNTAILLNVVNPDPGGSMSNAVVLAVSSAVTVTVTPDGRSVRCGATLNLAAAVANTSDQVVTWQVNGVTGGSTSTGTISTTGVYTAPAALPAQPVVTVAAIAHADSTAKGSVTISLQNPLPVVTSSTPNPINPGTVTLTVNGTGFAPGATVYYAGSALPTTFVSATQVTATGTVGMPAGRIAAIKVANPNPGGSTSTPIAVPVRPAVEKMPYVDAVRFLEMASFGPTPQSVVDLQTMGRDAWLTAQLAQAASQWPMPNNATEGVSRLQTAFFDIAMNGSDQLRQRVAFALGQILVVSSGKDTLFEQMVPYQRLLADSAFGNYRQLMNDITLHPSMGYFLDMVNNDKANPTANTVANENYAREIMQLFSIGLNQLNIDGTPAGGSTQAEYVQSDVAALAKVMTGWTYGETPYFANNWNNPAYFFAPMTYFDAHHDTTAKDINLPTPCHISAGGTAQSDLTAALDCLFGQTNVAPFVSYRLIQRLVKSSPSSAYVGRVAAVFIANKGDLTPVIKAILTDSETTTEGSGKLVEPILYSTNLLRALNAVDVSSDSLAAQTNLMGQAALSSPTVFNFYLPDYQIPGLTPAVVAPEFQIMNAATALQRANFAYRAITNGLSGNIKIDLTNLQDLANNPADLVEAVNQALYRGEMDSGVRAALTTAANASTSTATRVRSVLYAAAAAPQYQVQQ